MPHRSLRFVTLTGVDEKTDLRELAELSKIFPIEVGILLGNPDNGNRYMHPSYLPRVLHDIGYTYTISRSLRVSLHLCGSYVRMFEEKGMLPILGNERLVGRVQLNGFNPDRLHEFSWIYLRYGVMPIYQYRGAEPTIPLVHMFDVLQDGSGGKGIPAQSWFSPVEHNTSRMVGYAGGLTPDNITAELPKIIAASNGHNFWIDAETGLRSNDWFDLDKCYRFLTAVDTVYENHISEG